MKRDSVTSFICEQLLMDPSITLSMLLEQVYTNFDSKERPSFQEVQRAMQNRYERALSRYESFVK